MAEVAAAVAAPMRCSSSMSSSRRRISNAGDCTESKCQLANSGPRKAPGFLEGLLATKEAQSLSLKIFFLGCKSGSSGLGF